MLTCRPRSMRLASLNGLIGHRRDSPYALLGDDGLTRSSAALGSRTSDLGSKLVRSPHRWTAANNAFEASDCRADDCFGLRRPVQCPPTPPSSPPPADGRRVQWPCPVPHLPVQTCRAKPSRTRGTAPIGARTFRTLRLRSRRPPRYEAGRRTFNVPWVADPEMPTYVLTRHPPAHAAGPARSS